MTENPPPTAPSDPQQFVTQLWRNRPHRLPAQGKLGGVAAGVGARYGVDPLLVWVAFVVATVFGGAGVPVYLACWLFLPADGDETSAAESLLGRGRTSMSRRTTIVLAVLLAISVSSAFGDNFDDRSPIPSGLVGLALLAVGIVALHRRNPVAPNVPSVPLQSVSLTKEDGHTRTTPPAWDPLGAAPFAWDLPEPRPAPPEPERPRSRHTIVTLGLALIAGAVAVAVRLIGIDSMTPARIGAVALVVVGTGLVVGAFRRQGWWLLAVAAPLAGFVTIATAAANFDAGSLGDRTIVVDSQNQWKQTYDGGLGNLRIDMRSLELTADREVRINGGAGNVTVLLPDDLPVDADCNAGMGNVTCDVASLVDPNRDAPTLTLTVDGGLGNVEVGRG